MLTSKIENTVADLAQVLARHQRASVAGGTLGGRGAASYRHVYEHAYAYVCTRAYAHILTHVCTHAYAHAGAQ